MIRKILGWIVMYSLIIYIVVEFWPAFDFHAMTIIPPGSLHSTPIFLFVWGIFWLVYDLIRHILKLIAIPLNRITFGLTNIVVNVGMLYAFSEAIRYIDIWVQIKMWTFIEVIILAFILGFFSLFIKYL